MSDSLLSISSTQVGAAQPALGWLPVLLCILGAFWALCLLADRYGFRRGLVATFMTPAFLVPAAMSLAACWLLLQVSDTGRVHENPFGLANSRGLGQPHPLNLVMFAVTALTLAGHVGILRAWRDGRRPDGQAFFAGVVDHTLTFTLGKLVLFGSVYALSCVGPSRAGNVLYIVPTVLLAPLYAAADAHPRQPIAALRAALRTTYRRFDAVGRLVFGQVMFLVGSLWLVGRFAPVGDWDLLAFSSGSLSYNLFPFALLLHGLPAVVFTAGNALVSSVFITGYFLRLAEDGTEDAGEVEPEAA